MVFYIQEGDIFNIPQIRNYAHGCNCAGAMGKGIALQFRKKYPQMYKQYKTLCREGRFGIGEIFIYQYDDGVIFNLGTQRTWKEKVQLKQLSNLFTRCWYMLKIEALGKLRCLLLEQVSAVVRGLTSKGQLIRFLLNFLLLIYMSWKIIET